jgi:predicted RNase H-like nuclease (RuvC/YqgF family)
MFSIFGSLITRFLSSKLVTGILLLAIAGLLVIYKVKDTQLNKCRLEKEKIIKEYSIQINNLNLTIQNNNYVIANYEKQIADLENIIKEYENKTKILENKNKEVEEKINNMIIIKKALETKVNDLLKLKLPEDKKEKIKFANEQILKIFYIDGVNND